MDMQSLQHALEMLVPIAGTINQQRRSEDSGGMKPWQQIAVSIMVAAVIGVSSGYVSAQIALAVHAEKIQNNMIRTDKNETRIDRHIENSSVHRH